MFFLLFSAFEAGASPTLTALSGIAQKRGANDKNWGIIPGVPFVLAVGDSLRTGYGAKATVTFDDGSRIELADNSSFTIPKTDSLESGGILNIGKLKAFVNKMLERRFVIRTPTAVCSVRGTEFQVQVFSGGRTVVDLYKGLLGVEDNRGQQLLLHPRERVDVDKNGLGRAALVPTPTQQQRSQLHNVMRREMGFDMSKEAVQAAAAKEIQLAEYQQGKSLIDVFGQRVRLEEYIVRPQSNQFKLVALNERASRFDYFFYLGIFNKDLPADLSVALRQLPGGVDTAPEYFLTGFATGRSNTQDSMVEGGLGGHLVDVNHNNSAADDVAFIYNGDSNQFEDVAGRNVFRTIFDNYGFYINGKLKYGWTGNNAQSYADVAASVNSDPLTGAALGFVLPARSVSTTFPDPGSVRQVIYESYSDGTFIQWDNYIINDEGRVASMAEFQGGTTGVSYMQKILNFNYQQVITASEFNGRKIDLVIEPRILIQSGLIQ